MFPLFLVDARRRSTATRTSRRPTASSGTRADAIRRDLPRSHNEEREALYTTISWK